MKSTCCFRDTLIRASLSNKWPSVWSGRSQRCHLSSRLPSKSTVFSGIQPTGIPHIGNWFGALRQWVDLQDEDAHLLYAVVDLHAITVPQDASSLKRWKKETLAVLLAVGIDPDRSTLFFQSQVSAHAELMWILACQSSLGQLSRMTTWKSKMHADGKAVSGEHFSKGAARLGLLAYPLLQAADILVHGAQYVPVGSDQTQHLEFTRECARLFNNTYGASILTEPIALYSTTPRIMSLRNPVRKMSKSDEDPKSRIMLTDSSEEIERKVKASITDSLEGITYHPIDRPGVSNLIDILSYLDKSGLDAATLAKSLREYSMRSLKELLADRLTKAIEPIRETYRTLVETNTGLAKLEELSESGAKKASRNANKTLARIYEAMGLS